MDDFDEIYDEWVDAVNSRPLTSSRLDEVSDVININTQIIIMLINKSKVHAFSFELII
jgi:hypothetical protein